MFVTIKRKPERGIVDVINRPIHLRAESCDEQDGDDDVHCGARERHGQFLRGFLGDAFQRGDAADRKQRHFRRADAEAPCHQDMAEFVQHDAGEQQHHEQDILGCCLRTALPESAEPDPHEKDQECHVNAHSRSGNTADCQ